MYGTDPATDADEESNIYACPDCGHRTEAKGSCCCSECGCEMENLSKPRHW